MFKKLLYCSVILSITTIGSISNINASELYKSEIHDECDNSNSPLRKLFNNSENTLVFNDGVISCNDQIVDTDEYTHLKNNHGNNTIYINTNTLPIHSNTGGSIRKYSRIR